MFIIKYLEIGENDILMDITLITMNLCIMLNAV